MSDPRHLDLSATPSVERLLASLRGRLLRLVLFYGVGTVLAAAASWLVFAFLADWGLRVPHVVRVMHAVVLIGVFGVFLWRDLVRPLSRLPGWSGLALLFERVHPDLEELLISAVEFQNPTSRTDVGDAALVSHVLAQADERARALTARDVLDGRGPRNRMIAGTAGVLVVASFALSQPELTGIFVNHLLGGSRSWPQRTLLSVEVPGLDAFARIEETDDVLRLRVARGTDLPIVVRAEGVVPDEVVLEFDGGRDLVLARSGNRVFRTLLRSCQEDVVFHATGGDDQDGTPRVEVEVLQPPDVEGIAIEVTPPAYSGLAETILFDQDAEVLAGSELRIHVLPFATPGATDTAQGEAEAPGATTEELLGSVRLLPADVSIELTRAPYPAQSDALVGARDGFVFETRATESFGFRVELRDDSGLTNPDPGLFRVQVVEDRAPEIQVLAPARSDFAIVEGGAIPLRVRASDDFGLRRMHWRALLMSSGTSSGDEQTVVASDTFTLRQVAEPDATDAGSTQMRRAVGAQRIEVASLSSEEHPVAVDQRYVFEVFAEDNEAPSANEGRSLPIRARVVTPEELLRRMQDRLARARLDALELFELQREKRTRVEELVDAVDSDGADGSGEAIAVAAALSGQRRVLGDSQALSRELAGVAEDILYARLDDKAEDLLARYDQLAAEGTELRFRSEPWLALTLAIASGELDPGGFAQNLVELVGLALAISEGHVATAAAALNEAERAVESGARLDALVRAAGEQTSALASIETLLDELAEWDNFQNILSLTRDILHRQKALRERTQKFASEK